MSKTLREYFSIEPQTKIETLPLLFADATHDIYLIKQHHIVIKQVRTNDLKNSIFWQKMDSLFNANLFTQFNKLEKTYQTLAEISPLNIPSFLLKITDPNQNFYAFSTSLMQGETLQPKAVNKIMVAQLATHLASCHNHKPSLIMPDLRWDQFLTDGQKITAFVDLDALIEGPAELDWTILEYLLTKEQAVWFLEAYKKIPCLQKFQG